MIRVLFVCHGNICRSPMAEFVFKDMVKKQGLENEFVIASAATSTEEIWNGIGNSVYPPAKRELARHGISCEGKRAVQMCREDYEKYDYLIGMDSRNIANMVRIAGGDSKKKISKLLAFAGETGDIADPWYTDDFEQTYKDIIRGCTALFKQLCETRAQSPCRQALLDAVQVGDEETAKELLWQTVIAYQGCPFKTVSGLPFSYTIKKGRNGELTKELWIDRRENSKSLAWSSISLAFSSAIKIKEANRPKALGDIRGVSYIYPMLWRFGVLQVPPEAEEKMRVEE